MSRRCGQTARLPAREWLERGVLTRAQVHLLLATTLPAIVEQVYPAAAARGTRHGS